MFSSAVRREPRYQDTIGIEPGGSLRVDHDLEHRTDRELLPRRDQVRVQHQRCLDGVQEATVPPGLDLFVDVARAAPRPGSQRFGRYSATPPNSMVRMAMTLERTGRSMKNLEIIALRRPRPAS